MSANSAKTQRGWSQSTALDGGHSAPAALRRAFDLCVLKAGRNIRDFANQAELGTWAWAEDGEYSRYKEGFFDIGNWTSSFFTGMALMAWKQTGKKEFLDQVLRLAPAYHEKAAKRHLDMHHDAGFLYSLYSVALWKLTGIQAHRNDGLAAAEALYQRFNPKGNFIRAWGRLDGTGDQLVDGHSTENLAIIDGLMNLPLLFWAAEESGDSKFYDAAVRQADTTLKCFVRPDDSVCHACRFDLQTGAPLGPDNACGFGIDSHWARGTAWAIYGFALVHRYTRDPRYLEASVRLALRFLSLLNEDAAPVWDFRLPPGAPPHRDASAVAIVACGLDELERLGGLDRIPQRRAGQLLERLCTEEWLNFDPHCRGILRNAYGNRSAYSSWGDYFLMEALARQLFLFEGWW